MTIHTSYILLKTEYRPYCTHPEQTRIIRVTYEYKYCAQFTTVLYYFHKTKQFICTEYIRFRLVMSMILLVALALELLL